MCASDYNHFDIILQRDSDNGEKTKTEKKKKICNMQQFSEWHEALNVYDSKLIR